MPTSIKDNPTILREIIMDHYQNPRNKQEVNDPSYISVHMDSTSCIDDIYIQIKVENDVVTDCKWHGVGCAISSASTSIMSELVKGKTIKQANYIMDNFQKMMNDQPFDEEVLGEAICFVNTNRQPSRITCATIGWRGLHQLFEEEEPKDGKGQGK